MGVGCPCQPVRNDIVTPRHLISSPSLIFTHDFLLARVKNQKAEDLEPEKAPLSLMANPVEEECNRGYICGELEITLKVGK